MIATILAEIRVWVLNCVFLIITGIGESGFLLAEALKSGDQERRHVLNNELQISINKGRNKQKAIKTV